MEYVSVEVALKTILIFSKKVYSVIQETFTPLLPPLMVLFTVIQISVSMEIRNHIWMWFPGQKFIRGRKFFEDVYLCVSGVGGRCKNKWQKLA